MTKAHLQAPNDEGIFVTGYDSLVRRDVKAEGTRIASSTWTASLQAVRLAWSGVVVSCLSDVKSIL